MLKNLMKLTWMFAAAAALTLFSTACEKEAAVNTSEVENYTDLSMYEMQERAGCGRRGCFEFVFPLTVVFPDGDEVEVEDYQELREAIRTWKSDNPEATERPTFAFPIDVLAKNGDIISVEDGEALLKLRIRCRRAWGPHRPGKGGNFCFRLVYPRDVIFPDGDVINIDSPREMKRLVRLWHRANPNHETHPQLVFPIQVKLQDGTIVEVETRTDLQELKETCNDED